MSDFKPHYFVCTNIQWDTDGEDVALPESVSIALNLRDTDGDIVADALSDVLSEWYGFCHDGFNYELIDESNEDQMSFFYENCPHGLVAKDLTIEGESNIICFH